MEMLRIDCGTCAVRGPACGDCMVTALLGPNQEVMELESDEIAALKAMTSAGLLPPLRLVRSLPSPPPPDEPEPEQEWFATHEGVV